MDRSAVIADKALLERLKQEQQLANQVMFLNDRSGTRRSSRRPDRRFDELRVAFSGSLP